MSSGSPVGASPSAASLDETLASRGGAGSRADWGNGDGVDATFERGDLVGRYVILEAIGRGATGLVVAAYDPELDRKVALKLLRIAPGVSEPIARARARLIREAQAMAKLAHPNVITVHDVGAAGDDVFIAMEFIDGGSLRDWLAREPRSWATIVEAFVQAGEGLAAAHAQGIVHRDFKPDNVLIRSNGRVGVADFGLARRDDRTTEPSVERAPHSTTLADSAVDQHGNLTMSGATLGTPAYMAPEQHLRINLDHRCDQFAFCVALWEALVGRRPFMGKSLGAIALNVTIGKLQEFPRDSPVPARVRAALVRGLQTSPDARFASMTELLAELRRALRAERIRSSRRPWARAWIAGFTLVTAVAVVAAVDLFTPLAPVSTSRLCAGSSQRMVGAWDPSIKAETRAVFERSKRPFAQRSFARAAATLDALSEEWIASHTAACEATRIYGEQSEDLLDRRMSCLAQRRGEIAAVAQALRAGDDQAIESVDALLATIEPIASCDAIERLQAEFAPPPAEQRVAVEQLRAQLANLEVRRRSGGHSELLPEATRLLSEAEALAYAPLVAELLTMQASLIEDAKGPAAALPTIRRAMAIAAESGHRRALVDAMILLAWIEGVGRGNFELGLWLLDQAEAEAHALGDPVRPSLQIKSHRGAVYFSHTDYDGALREFEAALEFAQAELGDDHVRVADLQFNLAAVAYEFGRFEQAEREFRAAIEHYSDRMGADHPEVAQCHSNLAATLTARGKLDEAQDHAKRAIVIWEADDGHSQLGSAYSVLGDIHERRGDHVEALTWFERGYAMRLAAFGEGNPTTSKAVGRLANSERLLGRDAEARARLQREIELASANDPSHPVTLDLRLDLAQIEIDQQQYAAAEALIDAVHQAASEARGERDMHVALALLSRAQLEHGRGRPGKARAALDEAEAGFSAENDPDLEAEVSALRALLDGR